MQNLSNNNIFFKLYATCIPVKGATQSINCDLENFKYKKIPNLLFDVLTLCKSQSIVGVKTSFSNALNEGIDNYLDVLNKENWGFFTDTPNFFPDLSLEWESPFLLNNFIIDLDEQSSYSLAKVIDELEIVGCEALQIRIYSTLSKEKFEQIISKFRLSSIPFIEVLIGFNQIFSVDYLKNILINNERFRNIIIHTSPKEEIISLNNDDESQKIIFTSIEISSDSHCGIINASLFNSNTLFFIESVNKNSCLNGKLSVDKNGFIKVCPSLNENFGHISDSLITETIKNPNVSRLWGIKKDQITICKDCEFRYICPDCRAFTQDNTNLYSKPSKCSYDPYNAKWN